MNQKILLATLAALSPLLLALPLPAGTIGFAPSTYLLGDTDVLTAGASQFAYTWNNTSRTVNGVTFASTNVGAGTIGGNLTLAGLGSVNQTAFNSATAPFVDLSPEYRGMLIGATWSGAGSATITAENLTIGHQYAVQVFVSDPRSCCATRTQTIRNTDGSGSQFFDFNSTDDEGGVGQYSLGIFTADAASQAFQIASGTGSLRQMNAIQLRDVTNIGYWTGTAGATWDAATTNNFAANLFSAPLNVTNFTTAQAPLNAVTFADHFWGNGTTTGVAQTTVTIAAGGVSTGQVLFQNNALNYTIASSDANGITGTTAVAVLGTGTTTLTGSHAYTGTTTVSPTSTLRLGDGTTNGTITSSSITNNGALIFNTLGTSSHATPIAGSGTVTKTGTGTQILSGTNTYTGTTTVNGGTLRVGNGTNLGALASSSVVTANAGGTIVWDNSNSSSSIVTISNTLSGAGTVLFQGSNNSSNPLFSTYSITGTNTGLTGTLRANSARLLVSSQNALGTAAIDLQTGASLLLSGSTTLANNITIGTGAGWRDNGFYIGALRLEGAQTLTGNITLNNTTSIVLGDNSGINSTIGGYSTGNHTLSGVISGPGDLAMSRYTSWNGGSTQDVDITLSGASSNTYTGKTVVDGQGARASLILAKTGGAVAIAPNTVVQMGSQTGGQANLRMAGNEQFGAGVVMNFVNASGQWMRFDLQGTTQTLAGLNAGTLAAGAGAVIQNERLGGGGTTADASLTLNGSGTYLYHGFIRDQDNGGTTYKLNLVKSGTGTQTLVGGNVSHTGTTTVSSGTLALHNTNNFRSATSVAGGASLLLSNSVNQSIAASTPITLNDGATLSHNASTDGNGFLVLGGAVTVSGNTIINQNSVTNTTGANKNLFLDGGLKGSGTVTINATNPGNGVIFRNNNTTFAGRMIVNGIASTTPNAGSGIGVGGNTTGLTNTDITLNGTMELLNQGVGWAAAAAGDFSMGALDGTGVMVGNFTGTGGQTRVRIGNTNTNGHFSGTIANGAGNVIVLTKLGTGTQTLEGTLIDYTGATTVSSGTLRFLDLDDLHSSTLTISAGATAEFRNDVRTFNRFSATSIGGNGTFVKSGTSRLTTGNATNQFARWNMTGGLIDIRAGEFRADYQDQSLAWVNNRASMNVESGALVSLVGGNHISVDALTGSGIVQNVNNWGVGIFTVGQNDGSGTFSGILRNNGGVLAFTKTGTGTQILSGTNTYTGGTTVAAGTLLINNPSGSGVGTGNVSVLSGATLGGAGFLGTAASPINLTVNSGGVLSPGNSPGTLTLYGNALLSPGATFLVDILNPTTDLLVVNSGTVNVTNAILAGTWGGASTNVYAGSLDSNTMQWLIDNQGASPIIGTFANSSLSPGLDALFGTSGEAHWVTIDGTPFAAFYNSQFNTFGAAGLTGGNDFLLIAIPEPSRALLLTLAASSLLLRRRRR